VVDGHSDAMMSVARHRLLGEREVMPRRHLPGLRAGGVRVQFLMVGGDFPLFAGDFGQVDHLRQSLELIEAFHSEHDENPDQLRLLRTSEDLRLLRSTDQVGFVLHWEGAGAADSLSVLRLAWRLGLRSASLTWNGPTHVADGSGSGRGAGLTEYGRDLVREMNRLGIVVDVSHLSDGGFAEVCELSTQPVIASHSNARALYDHPRNLTDEQIQMIAAGGGVIGVCAYPAMLSAEDRPHITDLVRHIEHIYRVAGPRHVGVGCDFTAGVNELWIGSAPMHAYRAELSRPFPEGFEGVSDLPRLRAALLAAGLSEEDVTGIMGENFLRVLAECLPSEGGAKLDKADSR
jgi:membrane dipeptidase